MKIRTSSTKGKSRRRLSALIKRVNSAKVSHYPRANGGQEQGYRAKKKGSYFFKF